MGKIVGLTFEAPSPKFPCPVCGKEYATEAKLVEHMKKKHPDNGGADNSNAPPPDPDNGGEK